jgi:hypothetical protein
MSVWRVPFLMPVRDCLRRSRPRVQIAKTAIAGDHVRAAFFYRVVSAIPIYVPSRDIFTAHHGASPEARPDEIPNHVAVARAATLIVIFVRVFATTIPPCFPVSYFQMESWPS